MVCSFSDSNYQHNLIMSMKKTELQLHYVPLKGSFHSVFNYWVDCYLVFIYRALNGQKTASDCVYPEILPFKV